MFNPKNHSILDVDASGYACASILSQVDNLKSYVVSYASHLFSKHEINYGITEKECLAIVFGCRKFRHYLHGKPFDLYTDHMPLTWLKTIKNPIGRVARWAVFLDEFEPVAKFRPGKENSAADALSRPVLVSGTIAEDGDEYEESAKNLDPYENDCLLTFLKTGKHMPGASKKQIKRVTELSNVYQWIDDSLYFTNAQNLLRVPKPEERRDIVVKAHALGHFGADSILKDIRGSYFWKNMHRDIDLFCKQCMPCQRNKKAVAKNHPALVIEVESIMDSIGIDCIWGLQETDQGYTGICNITERLTRHIFPKPLKTKEAKEIIEVLWEYICTFGPPRTILSDRGTEFKNQLMDFLCKSLNMDYVLTSAYNPRCNGQTERLNQAVIEILRTVSEKQPNQWDKWLPFVRLAYNTRINSSTGFAPMTLMFGRPTNKFADYEGDDKNHEAAILQRANEIRELVEVSIPKAISNSKNKQLVQKRMQDNAHVIQTKPLCPGVCVYKKVEGLQNKLEPRFCGPFFIVNQTARGNYRIKNALGEEELESIPLHKLKVVETTEDLPEDSAEVEKILNHRLEAGEMVYLVKWKHLPESENSWVPVSTSMNLRWSKSITRVSKTTKRERSSITRVKKLADLKNPRQKLKINTWQTRLNSKEQHETARKRRINFC